MVPLAVNPEALFAAGSAVVAAGDGLGASLAVLTAGFAAHTGLDAAGMVFGLAYQDAAESLLKAVAAAINACRHSGALIQQGASNYSTAEVASTLGGGGGVLQAPPEPVKIAAPGPPGTLGPGQPPPLLWALVQSFVDDVWPDGDVAALRAAAARWRTFDAAVGGTPGTLDASKSLFDSQHIPEGALIDDALSQMGTFIGNVGEQCGKLATTLDGFANDVEHAQNAIRDLLHRLGSLTDIAHDMVLIVEGDAIDEIKKIAEDIEAVLHNLGREARAFEQGIKAGMQAVDGLVVRLEKYTRGRLTHFLGDAVGNQVATTFDFFVNANEGVLKGAVGMALATGDLDPRWFLVDPKGAAATWAGMTKGSPLDILLHPKEGAEANLQMWKSLLHLEDWRRDRPGLGLGENLFDGAMLFVPAAGEAGGAAEGAGAAARGAEAAADAAGTAERAGGMAGLAGGRGALADVAKAGSGLTKDFEGLSGNPPKIEPPAGGRPVAVPHGKPLEAPVEPAPHPLETAAQGGRAPESPTGLPDSTPQQRPGAAVAPRNPASAGGPHEPAPAPAGGPHERPTPGSGGRHGSGDAGPPGDRPRGAPLHGDGPPGPHEGGPSALHPPEPQTDCGAPSGDHDHSLQSGDQPVSDADSAGGARHTISGHGAYSPAHGHTIVPRGTTITVYAEHGSIITDDLGNLIESGGDTSGVYSLTFLAGEELPDYTIYPPDDLNIMGTPQTVLHPTLLSELIYEDMGPVDLAVCTYDETCPTGKVYDVDGIFDQWTGTFQPYERYGF
ncbi:MAG: putative adhesin [Mycobacterium sp.]|uniref:putative adhesin n=1 Tax=Mycobacterium sp. TaxID=1785 RepID=UPI003F9ACCD7